MHTGMTLTFQNLDRRRTDREVMATEMGYARRAEELGFDSLWVPEHHFTDYELTPNVLQLHAWVAAQTKHLKLGTMVTVLPWQDPIRTAESFSVLDHLSGGRALFGMGRGLGRVEFEGFRTEMSESRQRFVEYAEAILTSLETGVMEYDGTLFKQPRVEIRPMPYATYRGRTYASAVSPESMDIMARLGVGLLVVAQKPWETTEVELATYRQRYLEVNGEEAPKPVICVFTGVSETSEGAQVMRDQYLQRYALSTVEHYEFDNVGFAEIEGYEYYGALANNINKHGIERFNGFLADLQAWGTPEQVTEKLLDYVRRTDAGGLVVPLCFGGMPADEARANFELFTAKVLPELQRHDVGGDIGVSYGPASAAVA
jgi:alkanesulfonate monooxygenase SsuD/methylene tetrahydromethanopterin reductase-like flavin-dependent oxidoreductase (luciferase family)